MPPTVAQCRKARRQAGNLYAAIHFLDASAHKQDALDLHDFFRACENLAAYVYAGPGQRAHASTKKR